MEGMNTTGRKLMASKVYEVSNKLIRLYKVMFFLKFGFKIFFFFFFSSTFRAILVCVSSVNSLVFF